MPKHSNGLHTFSHEMVGLLLQFMRGVMRRETHALATGRLSVPQFAAVAILSERASLTMRELAEQASVTKGAMTGLINRLVRAGYVCRRRDAKDRRLVWVSLTPHGQQLLREIRRQKRQTIEHLFQRLTAEDRETYLKIFRQICDSLAHP